MGDAVTAPADTEWVTQGAMSERTLDGASCYVRRVAWSDRVEWWTSVQCPGVGTLHATTQPTEADARAWCERWARVLAREVTP